MDTTVGALASDILDVRGLSLTFLTPRGPVHALRNVNLRVPRGSIVGVVGESGSGKSTLVATAMRLLPANAVVQGGTISFEGEDILGMDAAALRAIRGRRMSMIFQDPMTSLNPVLSIGAQMTDIQYRDATLNKAQKRDKAAAMLRRVGIPDPVQRLDQYPHAFSGGMRQRIAIAMALLGRPQLLIADEPTTALDVTMEAQIVHLLRELRQEFNASILFISHNLGLVAELCDLVVVLYAGEVVEHGSVRDIFHNPGHPYTELLLTCDPARIAETRRELPTIEGDVPDLLHLPSGCIFTPRCPKRFDRCPVEVPPEYVVRGEHRARCHLLDR